MASTDPKDLKDKDLAVKDTSSKNPLSYIPFLGDSIVKAVEIPQFVGGEISKALRSNAFIDNRLKSLGKIADGEITCLHRRLTVFYRRDHAIFADQLPEDQGLDASIANEL